MLRWSFRLESKLDMSLNDIQFIGVGELASKIIEHLYQINNSVNGLIIDNNFQTNSYKNIAYYQLFDQKIYNNINKYSGSINQEAINLLIKRQENEIKKNFISNLHPRKLSIWIADLGSSYVSYTINTLKNIYDKMFTGVEKKSILLLNLPLSTTYKPKILSAYRAINMLSKNSNNILCINDINKYIFNNYIYNIRIALNSIFNPLVEVIDCLVSHDMFKTFNNDIFYKTPQRVILIPINHNSKSNENEIFSGEDLLLINKVETKIDYFTIQSEKLNDINLKDIFKIYNIKEENIQKHKITIGNEKINLRKSWIFISNIPLSTLDTHYL